MEFDVEITETLQRSVHVDASSCEEAVQLVRNAYRNEEVVLGADDFMSVEIKVE